MTPVALYARAKTPIAPAFWKKIKALGSKYAIHWQADATAAAYLKIPPATTALQKKAAACITLGGDGTFLGAVRALCGTDAVFVGSKFFGGLGFLTPVAPARLSTVLRHIVAGTLSAEQRSILSVSLKRKGKRARVFSALNEAAITQKGSPRLTALPLFLNTKEVTTYAADGLIVATPTGSTAYSLSAGGPIIHPSAAALCVTPLSSHTLTHRPLVVPDSGTLTVPVTHLGLVLTLDGQITHSLTTGDVIQFTKSPWSVKVHVPPSGDYFTVLRSTLHWGRR